MKYAIRYNSTFKYFSNIDEVIFPYNGTGDLSAIVIKTLPNEDQKAIIDISNMPNPEKAIPAINTLKQEHKEVLVQIDFYNQKDIIQLLKDNQLSFMFSNYVKDFSTLVAMKLAGAAEVYIVEDICFYMFNFEKIRQGGLKIRVIPNIAQCPHGTKDYLPEITKFFIRPEDVCQYEDFVDTFELYSTGDDRISTIYEIYKKEQWLGDIGDIILDFHDTIPNTGISPHFGRCRVNCKKDCTYKDCSICTEIAQLAPKFKEVGLEVIKKQKKREFSKKEIDEKIEELKERGKDILDELKIDEETLHIKGR